MANVALVINGQVIEQKILEDELLRVSGGLAMDSPEAGAVDHEYLRSMGRRRLTGSDGGAAGITWFAGLGCKMRSSRTCWCSG
jgi:hypothetical protein